jgi:hypothetical protein
MIILVLPGWQAQVAPLCVDDESHGYAGPSVVRAALAPPASAAESATVEQ